MLYVMRPTTIDYYSLIHGTYQGSLAQLNLYIIGLGLKKGQQKTILKLYDPTQLKDEIPIRGDYKRQIKSKGEKSGRFHVCFVNEDSIVNYELVFDKWLLSVVSKLNLPQSKWPGKERQHIIYDDA